MAYIDNFAPLKYGMTLTFQVEGNCSLMQCHAEPHEVDCLLDGTSEVRCLVV